MPDIRNCRRCGRVFNYIGGASICAACREKEEEDFKKVKEYLYTYPGATLSEVSTALDISVEKIKKFLKEGRLEIIGDEGNFILECEMCGKSIKTGRFCEQCEKEVSNEIKSTAKQMRDGLSQPEAPKGGTGLRYLNKNEKKL